jgi:alpha-tubulin suppressor-like RCC1 family protein
MSSQDTDVWAAIALAGCLSACQSGSLYKGRDAAADRSLGRDRSGIDATKVVPEDASAVPTDADPADALVVLADAGSADGSAVPADASVDAVPVPATIVRILPEPWGPNCPRGGVRVVTALDLDGNHTIDSADQTLGEQYICNVYPVSVSLGPQHSCALASNGTVWCWGADDVGQLGDYGQYPAYAPRPVGGVETALALAVGGDFSCVILPTTGVRCWGKTDRGQGGHDTAQSFIAPSCVTNPDDALLGAISLALGGAHACVVLDDGTVNCWGANDAGQIGDGTTQDRHWPVPVLGTTDARSVVAGGRHTCVLLKDTTVRCWGADEEGQLGDGSTTAQGTTVTVANADGTAPLAGVTALAAGDAFTCALMQDATLSCWGANADCQLGLPAATRRALLPVAAPVRDVQSVAAGSQHACAVLGSGKAVCWGRNDFGQVGAPAGECRADPTPLPLAHVLSIGAGRTHSCAVDEIGLWCWGDDSLGQLGIGVASATRSTSEPQPAIWNLAP